MYRDLTFNVLSLKIAHIGIQVFKTHEWILKVTVYKIGNFTNIGRFRHKIVTFPNIFIIC